jgi:hypothetical protein
VTAAGELVIKGEIEVLRLQPGDTIVVTLADRRFGGEKQFETLRDVVGAAFPGHPVVFVANGIRLSAVGESA